MALPSIIYCTGSGYDGKQLQIERLLQALAQRSLCAGVVRCHAREVSQDFLPPGGGAFLSAGAKACIDVRPDGITLSLGTAAPEHALEHCRTLLAGCHVMLVDAEQCGPAPGVAVDCRDGRFAGFSVSDLDAEALADRIAQNCLQPLVSAAVLAGGRSSRLGRNKALLPLNGKTVIETVIGEVSHCAGHIMVITNTPDEYRHLAYPCLSDVLPGCGPLSGIHAALTQCPTEYALVVSCDIPLVARGLFDELIAACPGYDIVMFKHDRFEPLCALYRRTCVPALEELIAHGEYRIIDLFPTLQVKVLRTAQQDCFISVNTDEDYEYVRAVYASRHKAKGAGGRALKA